MSPTRAAVPSAEQRAFPRLVCRWSPGRESRVRAPARSSWARVRVRMQRWPSPCSLVRRRSGWGGVPWSGQSAAGSSPIRWRSQATAPQNMVRARSSLRQRLEASNDRGPHSVLSGPCQRMMPTLTVQCSPPKTSCSSGKTCRTGFDKEPETSFPSQLSSPVPGADPSSNTLRQRRRILTCELVMTSTSTSRDCPRSAHPPKGFGFRTTVVAIATPEAGSRRFDGILDSSTGCGATLRSNPRKQMSATCLRLGTSLETPTCCFCARWKAMARLPRSTGRPCFLLILRALMGMQAVRGSANSSN